MKKLYADMGISMILKKKCVFQSVKKIKNIKTKNVNVSRGTKNGMKNVRRYVKMNYQCIFLDNVYV